MLAGSPAIGAGDVTNAPAYDQRGTGYPRLSMGKTDIGALETQPMPSFTVQWSSNQVILTNTSGMASAIALSTTTNPMEFDITSADPIAVTEVASAGNFTITNDGFGDVTVTLVAPGAVPTQFSYVGDAQDDALTLGTVTETNLGTVTEPFDLSQFGPNCSFVMDTSTTPGGSDSLTIASTASVSGSGNFTTTTNAGGGNSFWDIKTTSSGRIVTATGSVNLTAGNGTGTIELNCPDGQNPITSSNISLNAEWTNLDNGTLSASGLAIATSSLSIGDNSGPANSAILRLEGNNQIQQGRSTDIYVGSDGRLDLNSYRQTVKDLTEWAGSTVITYAGSLTLDGDSYVEVPQAKNTALFSGKLLLGPGVHTYWIFTVNQSAVMAFGPLLTTPGVDLDISGSVSDDSTPGGGLTINLPGVIQLSGSDASDDYTGGTSVDDGTLLLDHTGGTIAIPGDLTIGDGTGDPGSALVQWLADSQMDSTGNVTLLSDGQLDLNGFDQTLASLDFTGGSVTTETGILTLTGNVTTHASASQASITGELDFGANTPTFTVANGGNGPDMVVNAVLDGTGSGLTKEGAGELVLMGSAGAGFTGPVDVAAGRADIGGQYASNPVTVEPGATLGGVNLNDPTQPGDIGAVTVDAGGTVGVGSTAQTGILDAASMTYATNPATSVFAVSIDGTVPGTGYSQLQSSGVTLNGATLDVAVGPSFKPAIGTQFTIISGPTADPGTFNGLPEGAVFSVGTDQFRISYQGGAGGHDVVLTTVSTTATSLSSAPNSTNFGQNVTFTAAVSPSPGAGGPSRSTTAIRPAPEPSSARPRPTQRESPRSRPRTCRPPRTRSTRASRSITATWPARPHR